MVNTVLISTICIMSIMLWLCCYLIKTIPEKLLIEYKEDQKEINDYQLPKAERYHYISAITSCSILFAIVLFYIQPSNTIKLSLLAIFCWTTVLLAMIDWRARLLTDNVVYPFLWIGLIASTMHIFCNPAQSIYGAVFFYLFFWTFDAICCFLSKRDQTIGKGDMKMSAALGAWFGLSQSIFLLQIILITSIPIGLIYSYCEKKGLTKEKALPYGVVLAISSWVYYGIYQL